MIKLTLFRIISQLIYFYCLRRFGKWLGFREKIVSIVLFFYIFTPDYLGPSSVLDFALRAIVTIVLIGFCINAISRKIPHRERVKAFAIAFILTAASCLFMGGNSPYSTSKAPYGRIKGAFPSTFQTYKTITPLLNLEINNDSVLSHENQRLFYGHPQESAVVPRRVLESLWVAGFVGSYEPAWIDGIVIGNILLFFIGLLSFYAFSFFEAKIQKSWCLALLILLALNPRQLSFISQTLGYSSGFFLTLLGSILLPWAWEAGLLVLLMGVLSYDTWYLLAFLPPLHVLWGGAQKKYTLCLAAVTVGWHILSLKLLPSGGNLGWFHQLGENFKAFFLHNFQLKIFFEHSFWILLTSIFALGPYLIPFIFGFYFYSKTWRRRKKLRNGIMAVTILAFCVAPVALLAFGDAIWDGRIVALCPRYADSIYFCLGLLASLMASSAAGEIWFLPPSIMVSGGVFFLIYGAYLAGYGLYPWYYIWQIPGFGKY